MYNYITGKVVQALGNTLVLENNGIGYEIGVSGNTLYDVCNIGSTAKIYTYLYVREDTFALYGFSTLGEKTLFLRLIEISGVGPKLAMQILSGMDLNSLSIAIATGDIKTLSKIKGLGKKTAELIVVSIRDQVSGDLCGAISPIERYGDKDQNDAVFILVSQGMSNTDAVRLVAEVAKTTQGLENILREAFKRIN